MGSPGLDLCWCHQFGSPGSPGVRGFPRKAMGGFFVTQPRLNIASARTAIPPSWPGHHLGRTWHPRWCWFSSSQLGTQIFRPEPIKNLGTQRIEVHFWCRNANFWWPFSGYFTDVISVEIQITKKNAFFIQFEWGEKRRPAAILEEFWLVQMKLCWSISHSSSMGEDQVSPR